MDKTDPHLRTNKISSRVAPASSAARMWWRVPSALRLVQAAFKLTLTNSINFRGQNRVSPRIGAHLEAELGPLRIPFTQRVQS